jgi:hypothetical protein
MDTLMNNERFRTKVELPIACRELAIAGIVGGRAKRGCMDSRFLFSSLTVRNINSSCN